MTLKKNDFIASQQKGSKVDENRPKPNTSNSNDLEYIFLITVNFSSMQFT